MASLKGLSETGPSERTAGKTGNAPGNDQSGTWVRVAEWLSGLGKVS